MECPICKKPLQKWYSGYGGQIFMGCSDIICSYKYPIPREKEPITESKGNNDIGEYF